MAADGHVSKPKRIGWRFLETTSPVWAFGVSKSRLRILAYHGVPDATSFRKQAAHLVSRYVPIPSELVVDYLWGGDIPPRSCWVTFDDGDPNVIDSALQILEEFSIPATLFVCAAVIDTTEPFWWQVVEKAAHLGIRLEGQSVGSQMVSELKHVSDPVRRETVGEIRAAVEDRIGGRYERRQLTTSELVSWSKTRRTIGNHTWDHPLLDTCSEEQQRQQIDAAHGWLADRFGVPLFFAYPNGNHTDAAERRLKELGYRAGLLFDHRIHRHTNPLQASRIRVNANDEAGVFKAKVSGVHPFVHRMLARQ